MQTFFITPMGRLSGVTTVSLGIVTALEQSGLRVGFVKPIAQSHPEGKVGRSNQFARALYQHYIPKSLSSQKLDELLRQGEYDAIMEEVMHRYQNAAKNVDVMVVEGLVPEEKNPFTVDLNEKMARNLQAGVILVATANQQSPTEIAEQIDMNAQIFAQGGSWMAGYILNRIVGDFNAASLDQAVSRACKTDEGKKLPLLAAIPNSPVLLAPRVRDVADFLDAKVINKGQIESRRVLNRVITGRAVLNILPLLTPGALVITPGDREDVIMAIALTALSGVPLAGLLLTSDCLPDERTMALCQPALSTGLPVMVTKTNSYDTATKLGAMSIQVPTDDLERMKSVVDFVAKHLLTRSLTQYIDKPREKRMSPPAFRYQLIENARAANKRIVLPEGDEPRTVKAAIACHEKGIARCVLLGERTIIEQVAQAQGLSLPSTIEIIDPASVKNQYVDALVSMRKHKGMTRSLAEEQLSDSVVLGTVMLALDEVDGLVSGAVHTTASTIRPALQLIKTAPEAKIVSSVFFMLMPDQVYVYGDCAVNPDPTAEELADIALQSAQSAQAFGIEPRVAMISYSTGTSGMGVDVEKVHQATEMAKTKNPELMLDGPMQYDAASVMSVGKQKAPDSTVAGRATVFIFPDLNTGNTTYKAVQRSANVLSIGPMLQGLRKPVNDLSRGALVDDIVFTIALTAIQASSCTLS